MSHVPYGYLIENGEAKVDERAAQTIRDLFAAFIECKSMSAAATMIGLNKAHATIGRILKNKIYIGTDFYPQIVDEGTFRKVNELRMKNAIEQNRIKDVQAEVFIKIDTQFCLGTVKKKYERSTKQAPFMAGCFEGLYDDIGCGLSCRAIRFP